MSIMFSGYTGENCKAEKTPKVKPTIGEGLGRNSKGEICVKINPVCSGLKVTKNGLSVDNLETVVSYNYSYRGPVPANDFIAVLISRGNVTRVDVQALESNLVSPLKGDYDVELWLNGQLKSVVSNGFRGSFDGRIRRINGRPNLINSYDTRESNTFGVRLRPNSNSLSAKPKTDLYLNYTVYVEMR